MIPRPPARLSVVDVHAEPNGCQADPRAATVTLRSEPLFSIVVGGQTAPSVRAATDAAVALLDSCVPVADALTACAAMLHGRSITLAATAGAVFRTRGRDVACVVSARGGGQRRRAIPARPGDLYALCSPGLIAAVPVARIESVLRTPDPASLLARRLLAFANQTDDAREAAVVVFLLGGAT